MKKIAKILIIVLCFFNLSYSNEIIDLHLNTISSINLSESDLYTKKILIKNAIKEGLIQSKQEQIINLIIKDHKFNPEHIVAHNASRIKIIIHNQDSAPEEFESNKLNREKIIPGNSKVTIILPVLKIGEYDFFGDFHPDDAKGILEIIDISDINKQ